MAPVGDTQPEANTQASSSAPAIVLGTHADFGAQISDKTVDVRGTGASGSYTVDQGSLPKEVTEQDVKQMLKFASEFLSQKEQSGGTTQQFDMSLKHILETQQDNIEAILMSGDAETCMTVIAKQAEMLEAHGPAAGRGIGKALVKVADPRYLATTAYYSVEGGLKALAFILSQSAKLQLAEDLSISNPEAAKQIYDSVVAANEQVTEAFKGTIEQFRDEWHASSGPERTERIFSFLTELAAAPAFQATYLKYCGKACGVIGTQLSKIHLEPTPCLVTPDGMKVPVQMATEGEIASEAGNIFGMEGEIVLAGNKAKPGTIEEAPQVMPAVKTDGITEEINQTPIATLKNGYYEVNGFKFSEYYYNKLWGKGGRPAPSLVAREILDGAETCVPDIVKKGFFRYEFGGWEMIYNPVTKEVWHLQPIR